MNPREPARDPAREPARDAPRPKVLTVRGRPAVTAEAADPVEFAFRPMHKTALGAGVGMACALTMFVATASQLMRPAADGIPLELLAQFFAGYTVTWGGALIGAAWGIFVGFVAGWFFAFARNMLVGTVLFLIRAKAELAQTRDFLDHI
jgi:pheromone shutdown protein TraB